MAAGKRLLLVALAVVGTAAFAPHAVVARRPVAVTRSMVNQKAAVPIANPIKSAFVVASSFADQVTTSYKAAIAALLRWFVVISSKLFVAERRLTSYEFEYDYRTGRFIRDLGKRLFPSAIAKEDSVDLEYEFVWRSE